MTANPSAPTHRFTHTDAFPGIKLSNGHVLRWIAASGALGFDGKGWPWERVAQQTLRLLSLGRYKMIDTSTLTVVAKTLTLNPRKGNLSLAWPFSCIRPIKGGWVNKVGLTNDGFHDWLKNVAPKIEKSCINIVVSIFGTKEELIEMVRHLNKLTWIKAIEINVSCPNTEHGMPVADQIVDIVREVLAKSKHPVLLKLSTEQPVLEIAIKLSAHKAACRLDERYVEAISLNSVPYKQAFPSGQSPLHKLEQKLFKQTGNGGGSGGVSGRAAQPQNWKAIELLCACRENTIPVTGVSIWEYEDIDTLMNMGAKAIAFGSVFMWKPWAPCRWAKRWDEKHKA